MITAAGLVGTVTTLNEGAARVRLITDQSSAVSAIDLRTRADGIVQPQSGGSLMLDRVSKKEVVNVGDEIVTAGWRSGQLSSLYPKGIMIGRVTFVGGLSTDLYQQVLIRSDVDFSALDSVTRARLHPTPARAPVTDAPARRRRSSSSPLCSR